MKKQAAPRRCRLWAAPSAPPPASGALRKAGRTEPLRKTLQSERLTQSGKEQQNQELKEKNYFILPPKPSNRAASRYTRDIPTGRARRAAPHHRGPV